MPIDKMMKEINKNPALTGALGGAAGGVLVGALAKNKTARKVLKSGGLMAVGALGWQALQSFRGGNPESAAADQQLGQLAEKDFDLVEAETGNESVQLVIQTMIAAAYADGHFDDSEKQRIWKYALDQELGAEALASLANEINHPKSVYELAAQATCMEQKIEVYAAASMLMEAEDEAGKRFLSELEGALSLPEGLASALQAQTRQAAAA